MTTPIGLPDPAVVLPRAVRAGAARADEIIRQMNQQPEGDVTEPGNQDPPEPPVQEPPAQDPPTQDPPVQDPPPENWEHKYNSLKGRFDHMNDTVANLRQEASQLRQMLSTLSAPASADPPVERPRYVTEEEEREYGPELVALIRRAAKEELEPELKKIQGTVEQTAQAAVLQAREKVLQTLDNKVPNWRQLNYDEVFNAWLDKPDTYSGQLRRAMLMTAFNTNDAVRVTAFFEGFLRETTAVAPRDNQGDQPAPAGTKVNLRSLAAPGRAQSAAADSRPADKQFFTSAQIAKFYADRAKGRYRGREAEADKIEKQIFEAEREGRISVSARPI